MDNVTIPTYSHGNCPDTLAWSNKRDDCLLECVFPFYPQWETETLFIIDQTLAVIGFTLCYFYCFTGLFRPLMTKFPNSNLFHLHFSLGLMAMGILFPLILGRRYVFCDSNTEIGNDNWACVVSG